VTIIRRKADWGLLPIGVDHIVSVMPRKSRQVRPPSIGEFVRPGNGDRAIDRSVDHARLEIAEAISGPRFEILDDLSARLKARASDPAVIDAWAEDWNIPRPVLELGVWVLCWGGDAGTAWLDNLTGGTRGKSVDGSSELPANVEPFWSGDFEFRVEGRDLTQTSLAQFVSAIEWQFASALGEWKAAIERRAVAEKLVRANPVDETGRYLARHYEWFVEFHCLDRTYAEIADEGPRSNTPRRMPRKLDGDAPASQQAVADAVRKVAELARIRLRSEGRRGRPPRSAKSR
jgi:hypothetical protein